MKIYKGTPYTQIFGVTETDCIARRDEIVNSGFFARIVYSAKEGRGLEFVTNDAPNIVDFGVCTTAKFCDAVLRLERSGLKVQNWMGASFDPNFDVLVQSDVYGIHDVLWVATRRVLDGV